MLRLGNHDDIRKVFSQLQKDAEILVKDTINLAFYMRGSIQYSDILMNRTKMERDLMYEFVTENLKSQKGSMSPVF